MAVIVTKEFIEEHIHGEALNASQATILGLLWSEWINRIEGTALSDASAELFIRLKGVRGEKEQARVIAQFKQEKAQKHDAGSLFDIAVETQKSQETLRIYCDGACSGNPGPSGSGLAIYETDAKPLLIYGGADKRGTNNTAELKALIYALEYAQTSPSLKVTIFSDSKYSIDCVITWAYGWKAKGWTKKGGEIKNLELVQRAHTLYEQLKTKVTIKHVKGHAGIEGNELADRMALMAIAQGNTHFEIYPYKTIGEVLAFTSDSKG
jgi:ribonuclease HI